MVDYIFKSPGEGPHGLILSPGAFCPLMYWYMNEAAFPNYWTGKPQSDFGESCTGGVSGGLQGDSFLLCLQIVLRERLMCPQSQQTATLPLAIHVIRGVLWNK